MSLLVHDRWTVQILKLRNEQAYAVWLMLQQHPSLFTDDTSREFTDWLRVLDKPEMVWLGVYERNVLVGLIYLDFSPGQGNVEVHLMFFDRKPAEKAEMIRALIPIALEAFPKIKRLFTTVPTIYRHTWKLAKRIGMHWVGTEHSAVSIAGQRRDVYTFELLREEVK